MDSFGARSSLRVGAREYEICRLGALAGWNPSAPADRGIAFTPARVLLQDFTGVPALADLAAMPDAMAELGGDPKRINPLLPVELVIDHSIQVDVFGVPQAFDRNEELDYRRNEERYRFIKWSALAFSSFSATPPNAGICHQVNLEFLSRATFGHDGETCKGESVLPQAYPDTLVGTDPHTPMVSERARRARLGRPGHRGRSRDARPPHLDAHAA